MDNFWQLGDELRAQLRFSEDHQWSMMTSKLAELTRTRGERTRNIDLSKASIEPLYNKDKFGFQEDNGFEDFGGLSTVNMDFKMNDLVGKNGFRNSVYNVNPVYPKGNNGGNNMNPFKMNAVSNKYAAGNNAKDDRSKNHINSNDSNGGNGIGSIDKRFKTLPSSEMLPRNEVLGGYIFVCNNDTMQEDLKRQLFGLPPRYRDSVRAITPGLPLFLYNYTTHQLHGVFEAASFGGSNIDPTAWEDKKCKGESRFPAQVRIRVRKLCKALEEDAFRPVLHHYDGPKFRLELSIPETLQLLDLCEQGSM